MKIEATPRGVPPAAGATGVGEPSLQRSRQVAGVRARLADKGLHKLDADLATLAWATSETVFEGWAGPAVPLRVLYHAREFVRLLPVSAPIPALTASDEGLLSFEWTGANSRYLVVMVSEDGMLVYSGRLGPRRRISGAEPLAGELPAPIRQSLQDVVGHD